MYNYNYAIFYECFLEPLQSTSNSSKIKINRCILGLDGLQEKKYSSASLSVFGNGIQTLPKTLKERFQEASIEQLTVELQTNLASLMRNNKENEEQYQSTVHIRLARFKELVENEIIAINPNIIDIYDLPDNDFTSLALLLRAAVISNEVFKDASKDAQFFIPLKTEISKQPGQIYYEGYQTVNLSKKLKPYEGIYFIYYYSKHYSDILHTGLIKIKATHKGSYTARMLFGITDNQKLLEPGVYEMMNASTNEEAFEKYTSYRNHFDCRYDQRFYLFIGKIEATDSCLMIQAEGLEARRKDHRMTIVMNIAKMEQFIKKTDTEPKYKGGLALTVSLPNPAVQKTFCFNMGISKIPLDQKSAELKKHLQLSINDRQRVQVQKDDDADFFDFLLKNEKKFVDYKKHCKDLNDIKDPDDRLLMELSEKYSQ